MTFDMPMPTGRVLPEFTLMELDMPEIKEWQVNDEKYMIVKVKMTGKRTRTDVDSDLDKARIKADFKVLSIKALGDEPVNAKGLADKDFERVTADAKSGKV